MLAIFSVQNRHTTLSVLTDQKNYQEDKCKIGIDYFVLSTFFLLITKLINIQMIIPTKERWKVDAFVKISAFSSTALVLVFDWSKSKSNGRNLNFQFAPSSCQIVYITTLPKLLPIAMVLKLFFETSSISPFVSLWQMLLKMVDI